ncbi:putative Protein phosphatase 2c [Quillaja saponaria]|uniref:protein-serine/threonine phosphatase n=1 Tax=Quillaja saponaria TaxID=32244 RepID=A0AAD7Q680_QUISA|nr:putative Protein phosphatase 2c [Quillaja saponaria]
MTVVCKRMQSDDDDESPAKCRERRRRRIEMRRVAVISAASASPSSSKNSEENRMENSGFTAESKRICKEEGKDVSASSSSNSLAEDMEGFSSKAVITSPREAPKTVPTFGSISVLGRSRDMEDAICIRTNLCLPELSRRQRVHFFAVYDGHGGPHVAELCKERMHVLLAEELKRVDCMFRGESGVGGRSTIEEQQEGRQFVKQVELEDQWKRVLRRSFERMDEMAMNTCACGSVGYMCRCHSMEVALGGSTAVVAILTDNHIVVANCGDSRAVLCRGGRAIPLSVDHKPDRSDELARIEVAGGRVIFVNGARVEGILAMSRAIEPEITFTKMVPEDECLILASDGLWDVISSKLACEAALECLGEGNPSSATIDLNARPQIGDERAEALYSSRSDLAAAVLTRLALARKSTDNISVIVVDLKRR